MKKTTLSMLILCASLALPAQAGFDEGLAAYNRGDYATALKEWRPLAEAGNAAAQYNLGRMYANGEGVPQNLKEALKWYRKAAEQGDARAQTNLGWMYSGLYTKHPGEPKDYREAAKWFRLAAEQGHAYAQSELGKMYANGKGVPQDYKEAVKWFRLAAEQGNAWAQNDLGEMYANGKGVPQDKVLAYALYNLSAARHTLPDSDARDNRDAIVKEMSPREIEAGQALTRELSQPGNFGKALDDYLKKAQAPQPAAPTQKADKASAPNAEKR
jgi:hypothetical protein